MRHGPRPSVIALAGPNGAGKSTVGPGLLRGALRVTEFVNADVIAQGLSAAVERVRSRVELGGHSVPEQTIRRRYAAGLRNFFTVYRPMATIWRLYDNSGTTGPRLVAAGRGSDPPSVRDHAIWVRMSKEWAR